MVISKKQEVLWKNFFYKCQVFKLFLGFSPDEKPPVISKVSAKDVCPSKLDIDKSG
jgi:hypothetical protein